MTPDNLPVHGLPPFRPRPHLQSADPSVLLSAAAHLQVCFTQLLAADKLFAEYVGNMKALGLQAVVFGGWARDRLIELIHQYPCPSKDIDMVALGEASIANALPPTATRNLFGGVGIAASTVHFDGWDLPDTFLIKRLHLPISFEQLPLTADYNVNAVVFIPAELTGHAQVFDAGAISALNLQVLDFCADDVAFPVIHAARSVILASRLRLSHSETVRDFIRSVCDTSDVRLQVAAGIRQYCPPEHKAAAISLFRSVVEHNG